MRATTVSPANIAFIKYWGRRNHELFIPLSTTNSMNLSSCTATTTVEFSEEFGDSDTISISGQDGVSKTMELPFESVAGKDKKVKGRNSEQPPVVLDEKSAELFRTLERIRLLYSQENGGQLPAARVSSTLSFPMSAGIASSAAGISAFTAAGLVAAGLERYFEDKQELSRQVRKTGSASAARSVLGGFTELLVAGNKVDPGDIEAQDQSSYAAQIADENHWDLTDITVVTESSSKKVSSSKGHELAETSSLLNARIAYLEGKPEKARQAILERDFMTLAELAEADWINMFAVMMTSKPAVFYFNPGSIALYHKVQELRASGLEVFCTFDAGPNPHLICANSSLAQVRQALKDSDVAGFVSFTLESKPVAGTQLIEKI
jgi:diphosphomevalonate decarboxylase